MEISWRIGVPGLKGSGEVRASNFLMSCVMGINAESRRRTRCDGRLCRVSHAICMRTIKVIQGGQQG